MITVAKADLAKKVEELGVTGKIANISVQKIIDTIVNTLKQNEKVHITGFGSFNVKIKRARIARNPKTGAKVDLPERKTVFFKASKELKSDIRSIG
ncbi:MAG: HU family DNA-binding protein [Candidatus Firestonebacteria bacterium]